MKHKLIRRLFPVLLALVLLCSLLPHLPLTADAATYSGSCGDKLTWKLDTATGKLTISGTGKMTDWEYSSDVPWYKYTDSINSVVISSGATSIGKNAFSWGKITSVSIPTSVTTIGDRDIYWCDKLTGVTIPANVTSIGNSAFYSCSKLPSVTIPAKVTTIADDAFLFCSGLTSIAIPKGVTIIGTGAFAACSKLTKITVASDNPNYTSDSSGILYNKNKTNLLQCPGAIKSSYSIPSSVTAIGDYAFYCCYDLPGVTIPSSVKTIGNYAFDSCDDLLKVTIPNSVTSIGDSAFDSCNSMTSVTIGTAVKTIGQNAFSYCDGLTKVTIPNSVTTIGADAFHHCDKLASVTLGSGLTSIGSEAFDKCISLTAITIPKSVTTIGPMAFSGCDKLTKITVASGNTKFVNDSSGVLFNKSKTELLQCPGAYKGSYTIPSTVTTISDYAFGFCAGLTGITIPKGVTTIRSGAFYKCPGLTSVTIPDGVTEIRYGAFDSCNNLMWVRVPSSVTYLSGACFGYNSSGKKIDGFIVYGYAGSEAQTFATNNGFTFRKLDPTSGFWDVKTSGYYYQPMLWALNKGIANGLSSVSFGPNKTCTRAQVVTFLWKAKGKPAPAKTTNPFVDVKESKYYYTAVLWAYHAGITKGADDTHFEPNGNCNRAQVVTFLWNAQGKPNPSTSSNPFVDVKESKYYYKAVLWAVGKGITKGVDDTHFGPNQTCTRGQVVTFLYKTYAK